MSEHSWFQDNLAGYSAGGLSAEERERFDRHRIACLSCARILAESQGFDRAMENLFTAVRPVVGWENRVIDNLRTVRPRRGASWSKWARFAASVAAVVVLGAVGAVLHAFVVDGNLAFPGIFAKQADGELQAKKEFSYRSYVSGPQGEGKRVWLYPPVENHFMGSINTIHDKEIMDVLVERSEPLQNFKGHMPRDGENTSASVEDRRHGHRLAKEEESLQEQLEAKVRLMDGVTLGDQDESRKTTTWNIPGKPQGQAEKAEKGSLRSGGTVDDSPAVATNGALNRQEGRLGVLALTKPFGSGLNTDSGVAGSISIVLNERNAPKLEYFSPPMPVAKLEPGKARSPEEASKGSKVSDLLALAGEKSKDPKGESLGEKKAAQPEPAPAAAPRKIIRTGEMEFEVDGFDAAVAGITRLVNGVKGGFVATVNSDKLPNGKVKGSIVVRLPPEGLDKFLLDVRQELGKAGELKSQRIGSQDVTKQYTDLESRLRGARAMEERFLQIIKTGKGEIKDLVAAENALGVWRTKIEEMEGEIRYYNNQVGLSTLTLTLYEKEIQAPAALVVSERVKMQLEVEDVDKAQKAALEAVAEAKGRVTKSEFKQHAAGQLEAILHFEVAPAAADKVRQRLRQLGIVTHQDSDRSQQTENAGSRAAEIKIKQNDVRFEVGLYNSANIQPREVLVIQIASLDVPAGFRKLQEAVLKTKGQVRTGQLNEQDKLNISAQLDFDVLSADKKAIDQAIAEAGKVISRTATQAAPGEAATDRKTGYRLALRNVAALPSREKISLGIEVKDVDKTAADILDMVKAKQGHVAGVQMNHERNGRINAILVFDVPLTAKDELIRQVKAAGTVRLQTSTRNPQVPDNELATAHIDVTLTSSGPIVPSDEGLWPQIRTSLFYSFKLLSWSLMFVILGLSVILPWMLVLWAGYKLVSKWRKRPAAGSL